MPREKLQVRIGGMRCSFCVETIKKGLGRTEVSFRDKQARVTFDQEQVSVAQLIDAVSRLGFRASIEAAEPGRQGN